MTAPLGGLVVMLQANRPTVRLEDGTEWLCHLAGKVRHAVGPIRVGDRVAVESTDPGQGVVTAVLPRGLTLERPPVANVTGLIVVFTLAQPSGSLDLLDRRLVLAELYGLRIVLLCHKSDLLGAPGREAMAPWGRVYPLIWTSVGTGEGLSAVRAQIADGIYVLTGESGAGKSSLLRALLPERRVRTGGLSRRERGRQTTRTVSLHPLGSGYLADTPGFSRLALPAMSAAELAWAFPELRNLRCRFTDCRHRDEPGCRVPALLASGFIAPIRLRHYRAYLEETVR